MEYWRPVVTLLVVLGTIGCSDHRGVELATWQLSGDVVRRPGSVTLPVHLDAFAKSGSYRLSTTISLPPALRDRPLKLAVLELHAVADLSVNGARVRASTPQGTRYRTRGPLEWAIPPQLTHAGELELALDVQHRWTQSAWWDVVPVLHAADRTWGTATFVQAFNVYVAFAAMICLAQLGLTGLGIYTIDRRRPVYLWLALQNFAAMYYPAFALSITQPLFGLYDAPVLAVTLMAAITASVRFTHEMFDLPRPSRGWLALFGAGMLVALIFHDPFIATRVTGITTVVILAVLLAYQLWISTHLALHHDDRWMARFLLVSWLIVAVTIPFDALHWLGFGSPAGGANLPSLGLMLFSFGLSLQLSRRHFLSLEREAQQREVANERLAEVQLLNQELRRQVADRSMHLLTGLALARGDAKVETRLAPGDRVHERYEVVGELGRGGMGVVYEVARLTDKRRFALKITHEVSGAALARLAREALVASRVDHPNVVGIVDVDVSASGVLYIVMELVDGKPLRAFTDRARDPLWAFDMLAQLAAGLAALHAAGVVHRDLKPANLLVVTDRDGTARLKIADFGVSRPVPPEGAPLSELDERDTARQTNVIPEPTRETVQLVAPRRRQKSVGLTRTGNLVGTPAYIAPEMLVGSGDVATSADLFAFGVIAWEMLVGERPFDKPLTEYFLDGGHLPEAPSLATRWDGDPQIVQLVDRCLAADPAQRPSAQDLETAFANASPVVSARASRRPAPGTGQPGS